MHFSVILCVLVTAIVASVAGQDAQPTPSIPTVDLHTTPTPVVEPSTGAKTNATEDHSMHQHTDPTEDAAHTNNNVVQESVPTGTESTTVKPPAAQGSSSKDKHNGASSIAVFSPVLLLLAALVIA